MDEQLALEREYLAMVQDVLLAVIEQSDSQVASHNESVKEILRDAWDELRRKPTALSPQDLEQLNAEMDRYAARRKFSGFMAERYRRMVLSPFFARVDFREEGQAGAERVMLGMYSLLSDSMGLLVTDWRAPVCSLFYDAQPGPACYECPAGIIEGEVTLKRQYRIADGRMAYYVDTSDALEDDILLEMLSPTSGSAMHQIVSTIQKEQNAAIRHELAPALLVTGGAGSGKTAVAMHRAAYLMYRHREHLSGRFMVVISPTDAFSEYISQVLPELGEDSVPTMTLHSIAKPLLKHIRLESPMEHIERSSVSQPGAAYPYSAQYARALEAFAEAFAAQGPEFEDIVVEGVRLFDKAELERLYTVEFAAMSPAGRLTRLNTTVTQRLEGISAQLLARYEQKLSDRFSGGELRYASKVAATKRLSPVLESLAAMLNPSPLHLYARAMADAPIPARRAARECARTGTVLHEHVAGVLWLMARLGFISPDRTVRHVIVDEAQDYSCVAIRFLKLRYPSASFTLLGDPNQALIGGEGPDAPGARAVPCLSERWLELCGYPGAPVAKLTHCYRSTHEITAFCNALLPEGAERPLETGRHGPAPTVSALAYDSQAVLARDVELADAQGPAIPGDSKEAAALPVDTHGPCTRRDLDEALSSLISDWQTQGMRRIAVITQDQAQASELARRLRVPLIDGDDVLPETGVCTLCVPLAKGLEFDAVAVVFRDPPDTPSRRAALYVACTRALSRLHVFAPTETLFETEGLSCGAP